MSVEDEISTVPNLRGRAQQAFEEAVLDATDMERDIYNDLRAQFWNFALEVLQVDPGTLACADISESRRSMTKKERHPSEPAKDQCLAIRIDGIELRAQFTSEKTATYTSGGNPVTVWDDVLTVEYKKGMTYTKFTDLATLGKLLAES